MEDDRKETILAVPHTVGLARLGAALSPALPDLLSYGGGIFPEVRDLDCKAGQTAADLKTLSSVPETVPIL